MLPFCLKGGERRTNLSYFGYLDPGVLSTERTVHKYYTYLENVFLTRLWTSNCNINNKWLKE